MRRSVHNSPLYRLRRKGGRLKRFLLHRRGDNVHSPYAFHLISKVLRNPHPFASFARLREETSAQRQSLRRQGYRDVLVLEVRRCELVFRLVHHHGRGGVLLLSGGDSLLPAYISATGKSECLIRSMSEELMPLRTIVVEDAEEGDLGRLSSLVHRLIGQERDLMLLYYQHNPRLRAGRDALIEQIRPDIWIDQGDFDICVWGKRLTPCKHFAYY